MYRRYAPGVFATGAGQRTWAEEFDHRTAWYTYDNLGRLKTETVTGSIQDGKNGTVTYGYDNVGNRQSRTSSLTGIANQAQLTSRTNAFTIGEVRTAIKARLPQAIDNLANGKSANAARNAKLERATQTNNPAAQGSLIHAELADSMHADNMSTLKIEVSYDGEGTQVAYGTKGGVRLDYEVVNGNTTIGIFDLKPSDMLNPTWLHKASSALNLSPADIKAICYEGMVH
jgi:YD repeat-containing protein